MSARLPCVPLPGHRMEDDFCPPMPYTLGYSATSKSTDSLIVNIVKGLAINCLGKGAEDFSY